jgi:hypothetical protein
MGASLRARLYLRLKVRPSPQAVLAHSVTILARGPGAAPAQRCRRAPASIFVRGERRSRPPLPATGIDEPGRRFARCGRTTPSIPLPPLWPRSGRVFRPMAWPSPDRRFEGSRRHDAGQSRKLAQRVAAGMAPLFEALESPPAPARVAIGFTSRGARARRSASAGITA